MCWHLPIFPGRHQPSIFGTTELNFCVRYGNRWTLSVINTNYLRFISQEQLILYYILLRLSTHFLIFLKNFQGRLRKPPLCVYKTKISARVSRQPYIQQELPFVRGVCFQPLRKSRLRVPQTHLL